MSSQDWIRAARANGLAVLLVSADLDELIGLSDSIKVMLRGRFVADADPAHVTPEDLGSAMTGAGRTDEEGVLVTEQQAGRDSRPDATAGGAS